MLQRAHQQLLDTIHRRMELTNGIWIEGSGWVAYDMGSDVSDSHLRGATADVGCDTGSLLTTIERLRQPHHTQWSIRVHPDALGELNAPLEQAGFHLDEPEGYPIMGISEPIDRALHHEVQLVPLHHQSTCGQPHSQVKAGEQMMVDAVPALQAAFTKLSTRDATRLLSNGAWTSDPQWRAAVIYQDDAVICFGKLTMNPARTTGGLYYISTDPRYRGQGLAKDLCTVLTNHAFALGAQEVILQASTLGEFVYRHLGYTEIGRYYSFVKSYRDVEENQF
ncbi:MAG: GNAT family N-acetyltransferase [Actinomycetaceae bacterium]|nr:GNAT family N-acetyltransferase [Actinomycetaceae bacterium]